MDKVPEGKERRKMNITVSSPLLHSLYSECLPLVVSATRRTRSPTTTGRKGRCGNATECDDENAAFLSSVEAPSELCMALACVARRREAVRRSERGPLLVFVPFDDPRDEIFVEIPISVFGDVRGHRGLRLLPLNENSLLCSRVRDGLPPRKGFFVTFRTRGAQQRFQDALNQVICDCIHYDARNENGSLRKGLGVLPGTAETSKEREGLHPPDALTPQRNAASIFPPQGRTSAAGSFIDCLLAERDRRREEYMASNDGSLPMGKQQSGGNDIAGRDQQRRGLHSNMWDRAVGAAERQTWTEWCEEKHDDTASMRSQLHLAKGANLSLYKPLSLAEREALFHNLRAAMEAYDGMSAVQGRNEISLMGTASQFLRQHQANLWRLQHGDSVAPQAAVAFTHIPPGRKEMSEEALNPSTACTFEHHQGQEQHVQHPCQAPPDIATAAQSTADTPREKTSAPTHSGSLPPTPALTRQNPEDHLGDELERARLVESRILSSLHQASENSMIFKRVFQSNSTTPLPHSSSAATGATESGLEGGEAQKREGVTTTFATIDVTSPTPMSFDVKTNNPTDEPLEGVAKETEGKSRQCGSGWREVRDPTSDKNYYVCTATKKTTWKIEDTFKGEKEGEKILACGAQWRAVKDPNTGSAYYVHKTTKATTWDVEQTLVDENGAPQVETTTAKLSKKRKALEWVECKDPSTGKVYYYNKKTRETTWNRSETDLDSA